MTGQTDDPGADGSHEHPPSAGISPRRQRRRRRRRIANGIIGTLAVAAAIGGGFTGAHPTGTRFVDPLLSALFAGILTLAAAYADRRSRLVLGALALGASRGLILLPALAALGIAFGQVWYRKFGRRLGAVVGALASQVLLRWPHLGFTGLTALLAAVGFVVVVVTAVTNLGRTSRRWWLAGAGALVIVVLVLAIPAAIGALMARTSVTDGIAATHGALDEVTDGRASDATPQIQLAATDFRNGASKVGAWWSAGARLIPIVSQQREALAEATSSARDVMTTASKDAGSLDYEQLRYSDGRIDLAKVAAAATPLDQLDAELTTAQHRLASLRSPWLVSPITDRLHSLGHQLDSARSSVNVASRVVDAAPGLLGGQGTRRYLVIFLNPAENRGLGGYISAYGILTASNGALSLGTTGQGSSLVRHGFNTGQPGSPTITGPADYLARYGQYLSDSAFGDLCYSPDLPTVDNVLTQVAPQVGLGHIDGTLAIDPAGLAALLRITGPVTIPGVATPLTSTNAVNFLLKGQYLTLQPTVGTATRHDYLQDALAQAFPKLTSGSLPGPRELAADLGPAATDGDIQFWSNHPADQPLLRSLHVSGAFPTSTDGEDLLAVTTSNGGNSKIDPYVDKTIDDRVTYDPGSGAVTDHVTITFRNTAPASGLPNYVIGNDRGLPTGTAIVDLAVYSPLGITEDPAYPTDIRPAPITELGVNAYDSFVDVAPSSSMTVSLTLVGRIHPGDHYMLNIRRQVSPTPDMYTVEVQGAPGYRVRSGAAQSVEPAEVSRVQALLANGR